MKSSSVADTMPVRKKDCDVLLLTTPRRRAATVTISSYPGGQSTTPNSEALSHHAAVELVPSI